MSIIINKEDNIGHFVICLVTIIPFQKQLKISHKYVLLPGHTLMNKLKRLFVSLIDFLGLTAGQSMSATGDGDELMVDMKLLELIHHHDRLLVRHIVIIRAVYQERRWILPNHILDRHVWVILFRFFVRVPTGHFLRPDSSLPAKQIEHPAVTISVV